MRCPHCGQDTMSWVETTCPDPDDPTEVMAFATCENCDYGINPHTEGTCACVK